MDWEAYSASASSRDDMQFIYMNASRPSASHSGNMYDEPCHSQGPSKPPQKRKTAAETTIKTIDQIKKTIKKKQEDSKKCLQSLKKQEAAIKAQVKKDMLEKKKMDALAALAKKQLAEEKKKAAAKARAARQKPAKRLVKKVVQKTTYITQYERDIRGFYN